MKTPTDEMRDWLLALYAKGKCGSYALLIADRLEELEGRCLPEGWTVKKFDGHFVITNPTNSRSINIPNSPKETQ